MSSNSQNKATTGKMTVCPVGIVNAARHLGWSAKTLQVSFPDMPHMTAQLLLDGVYNIDEQGFLHLGPAMAAND